MLFLALITLQSPAAASAAVTQPCSAGSMAMFADVDGANAPIAPRYFPYKRSGSALAATVSACELKAGSGMLRKSIVFGFDGTGEGHGGARAL